MAVGCSPPAPLFIDIIHEFCPFAGWPPTGPPQGPLAVDNKVINLAWSTNDIAPRRWIVMCFSFAQR
jgi:hypothetical protein